mmetsp:Transcript_75074/g.207081  ORF Transcript_75074/g.207081 Transcript_75074/m.207081 type:complete len:244 (-) Transcript_75074:1349-2080(-)
MPMPVSETATVRNSLMSSAQAVTWTCPRSVNFRAFVIRLYNICVQRWASASMMGKSDGTLLKSCTVDFWIGRPALSTAQEVNIRTSSTIFDMCTGSLESFIFLLCTSVDRSIMFVTKSSKRLAQLLIMCKERCMRERPSACASANRFSLRPMMPWRGERSSWVTVAANCDFLTSSSFMCVMSWPMQITPRMLPPELMRGAALSKNTTGSCAVVETSTSKFGVEWPAKASESTRWVSARHPSRM